MSLSPLALDGNTGLGVAILLGFGLGFILVKSDFAWEKSAIRLVTLRSGRLMKIFLLTMALGTVGFYFAAKVGLVDSHYFPCYLYSVIIGGVISGVGLALSGFFPISSIAALGAGRLYALSTIIGMVIFYSCQGFLNKYLLKIMSFGEQLKTAELSANPFGMSNLIWPIAIVAVVLTVIIHLIYPETDEK